MPLFSHQGGCFIWSSIVRLCRWSLCFKGKARKLNLPFFFTEITTLAVFEVSFLDNFFMAYFGFFFAWSIPTFPSVCLGAQGILGWWLFWSCLLQLMVYFWIFLSQRRGVVHWPSAAVRRSATWWQSFKIKPAPLKRRFELCFSTANLSVNKFSHTSTYLYVKQRGKYLALWCRFALNAVLSVPIKSLPGTSFLVGLFLWSNQVNDRSP